MNNKWQGAISNRYKLHVNYGGEKGHAFGSLLQKEHNSIANALELHLFCINPSIVSAIWQVMKQHRHDDSFKTFFSHEQNFLSKLHNNTIIANKPIVMIITHIIITIKEIIAYSL